MRLQPLSSKLLIFLLLLAPVSAYAEREDVYDPIEPVNRAIFSFNEFVDEWVLEPAARGYRYVTPEPVRRGFRNFFEHIQYPRYLIADLIQLKFQQAAVHTGRFVLNTTLGLGGFIDASERIFQIDHHEEDIGAAFGYWGVPSGAYLVLPVFGPSNVRDFFGGIGDRAADPIFWASFAEGLSWEEDVAISWGGSALEAVTIRESLIEAIDAGKEASLDYYAFVRRSYAQQRAGVIYDGAPPGRDEFGEELEIDDDLEFGEEELEEEISEEMEDRPGIAY